MMRFGVCLPRRSLAKAGRFWGIVAAIFVAMSAAEAGSAEGFNYNHDTLSFANWTVFTYENGRVVSHKNQFGHHYSRRCFVMTRAVEQFYKFARFEPKAPRVDDRELMKRIRDVTRRQPWHDPLPAEKRVVIPGYRDLRELSQSKTELMQRNIGLGWVVYLRPGNVRMFYLHDKKYQVKTHDRLEQALGRGQFFIAYLSDFPILHINHSVLVYKHSRPRSSDGSDHYLVYDPNHPDGPRHLEWLPEKREFSFEKDREFAGGFTRVFEVYGKALQ